MPHAGEEALASAAAEGHGAPHAEPHALGLDATAWVALAMLAVLAILLWKNSKAAFAEVCWTRRL